MCNFASLQGVTALATTLHAYRTALNEWARHYWVVQVCLCGERQHIAFVTPELPQELCLGFLSRA